MSDRGFLFIFSVLVVLAGIGTAVWLVATHQADSVDGLFLLLTSLAGALVFGLYLAFLIHRAMDEAQPPAAAKVSAATGKSESPETATAAR